MGLNRSHVLRIGAHRQEPAGDLGALLGDAVTIRALPVYRTTETGQRVHRRIPRAGHNLPQEEPEAAAPQEEAEAVIADAGSEQDVMAFIDRAVSTFGRLDAIWANAGVSGGLVPLADQTVEHWQEVLRVNLIGPFLAIKHSMPHMIKQKYGAIVCTASVAGLKSGAAAPAMKRLPN